MYEARYGIVTQVSPAREKLDEICSCSLATRVDNVSAQPIWDEHHLRRNFDLLDTCLVTTDMSAISKNQQHIDCYSIVVRSYHHAPYKPDSRW